MSAASSLDAQIVEFGAEPAADLLDRGTARFFLHRQILVADLVGDRLGEHRVGCGIRDRDDA
ncbi:hypothetical protein QP162_17105 [Sphingomonas aurantiaca]|uniref:hypothetical protein n=1 Tax=Sphingomonas aurantiaca TaxID=185949 RepID=UPI002FDF2F4B